MKTLGSHCSVVRVGGGFLDMMAFGCHDTKIKMAGEMEMMISLSAYNVFLYLQLQLDILSQTYSLVQRRRRALYLLRLSYGEKS